ncbi:MAG: VOC family protein [Gammaproteobacteria bacterium]|jgi:catechol 2,3-dioxygenase-like lactoylglutathione lyase family enzyme|nr:VOC family virulence protein [Gammaproteobacteria bacterium]MDP6095665.1 VOC family protein [Gammaproteobacteria bacterium]HJO11918.1 VOC family protein [Gammaproteobacteria bacterium]|tara:strand:- start:2299 stop:2700 length:402 start_codon:yes stop_codon:yes gene_type:complete
MIKSFDHIAVPMERVAEMEQFYTDLGCRVVEQSGGRIFAVIFGDNKINFHTPELWQSGQFTLRGHTAEPGSGDMCFVWQGSQEALLSTLQKASAEIEEGPVARTGGMNGGSTQGTSVYTRDPDNNLLEFIIYG